MKRKIFFIVGGVAGAFGILSALILRTVVHPMVLGHLLLSALALVLFLFSERTKSDIGGQQRKSYEFLVHTALQWGILIVLLAITGWFALRHDQRWDLTSGRLFSLDPRTVEVLENLKQPLRIVAIANEELDLGAFSPLSQLRQIVAANSREISLEIIDPRRDPHLLSELGMKPGQMLYLSYGQGAEQREVRLNQVNERAILTSILKIAKTSATVIYYVVGYGEPALQDSTATGLQEFSRMLGDAALELRTVPLPTAASIPADAAGLLVVAPQQEIPQEKRELILNYVRRGGNLALFFDPDTSLVNRQLAEAFGIVVGANTVLDPSQRAVGAPNWEIVVKQYGKHPVSEVLSNRQLTLFSGAASVARSDKVESLGKYTNLVLSSDTAWGETNPKEAQSDSGWGARIDEQDLPGPLALALALETEASRVTVFGDSTWLQNQSLDLYGNRDLALSTVNWTSLGADAQALPARVSTVSLAPITRESFQVILAVTFLIPELLLLAGLLVCAARRYA